MLSECRVIQYTSLKLVLMMLKMENVKRISARLTLLFVFVIRRCKLSQMLNLFTENKT